MMHQDQVWGNSLLASVGKKGMENRGKVEKLKIGIWVILSLNSPTTQAKLYMPKRPN